MTNTDARTQYRNARRRVAATIMAMTGAKLDAEATWVNDHIVIGGAHGEIERVRAHFANILRVGGVTIDPVDPEDPEWGIVRFPEAGIADALEKHAS